MSNQHRFVDLGNSELLAGLSELVTQSNELTTQVLAHLVFERIARGELHLCALCALAPHLNPQNTAELLDACLGKTRRQVEELIVARFPRPDVREQIRRLPARVQVRAIVEQPLSPKNTCVDAGG